ncbi:MAG: aminotransferase class I/II-fold pyridoxal phosphate-dependent enzyme [Gammaproteobacteria bacterium]|nr:aminotransferase class I/II-fold pyridoxal phosphate-dependent enzyme [Gammaproteobacteria bacterium]
MQIPPFKLERYFAEYEFNVDYLLCSSDCESLTIAELLAFELDAQGQFEQHRLGYTESQGSRSLRRGICNLYHTIEPDQVLVHTGAEEAIFLFMHAVLGHNDHIIVHWPCYQSLVEIARSIGCDVTLWQAREENEWSLDTDELQHHIQSNTKVIVINTPHNPTGYHMSQETFQEVNRIAQLNGIILFCDEVYREAEYQLSDRLPAACDLGEHAVSLGVMSKTYGLAGLRIGWIATHNSMIYEGMTKLKDYTTICNSAPSEFLAELALRHRDALVKRNVGIIKSNLIVLDDFFKRHADRFAWLRPKAGPIAFPRLLGEDISSFCMNLVHASSVLLLPGTVYDDNTNHFRIGFGRKNMPEAVARMDNYFVQHRFND